MQKPWLIALTRIRASIVDHEPFKVDGKLTARQLVEIKDGLGQEWNVHSCVALSGQINLIFFKIGELFVKLSDGPQEIFSGCIIIISIIPSALTESNLNYINPTLPGPSIYKRFAFLFQA